MKITPRQIVIAGAMSAITILLGVTKLGFIPFLLGTSITIMHVPVVVGAVLEGPWVGTAIGLMFGIFSLAWAYIAPNGPGDVYFQNPLLSVLPRLFIGLLAYLGYRLVKEQARWKPVSALAVALLIAVVAPILGYSTTLLGDDMSMKTLVLVSSTVLGVLAILGLYLVTRHQGEVAALGAAAVIGTLTNTVLVLCMLGILGSLNWVTPPLPWSLLLTIGLTNGIPEMIGAVLITIAVVAAWKQIEVGRKGARIFSDPTPRPPSLSGKGE